MINYALSLQHDRHRIMSKALMPWYRYAHEKELARRNEEVIRYSLVCLLRHVLPSIPVRLFGQVFKC